MLETLLQSPLTQLVLLVIASAAARRLFLREGESVTASGAIAMAIGIFVLGALQQLPFHSPLITQLLTLEGLIIWAYIAASYVASYAQGTFHTHTDDPVGCFAIGTWVAGTAVLARLVAIALPDWRPVGALLGLLAVSIWLWYLLVITRRYGVILAHPADHRATGRILLATVSTQSVVLLAQQVLPNHLPPPVALALILVGYLFYALGLALIVRRYLRQPGWRIADDWDNTNCILHGAMSITGLAALETGALPLGIIALTWVWVILMFVGVEAVEVVRLITRVRAYGWRKGVFTYHVSQWARNFTFGMLYAFTLRLGVAGGVSGAGLGGLNGLQNAIVAGGQYIVLVLLVIELVLFLLKNVDWERWPASALAGAVAR